MKINLIQSRNYNQNKTNGKSNQTFKANASFLFEKESIKGQKFCDNIVDIILKFSEKCGLVVHNGEMRVPNSKHTKINFESFDATLDNTFEKISHQVANDYGIGLEFKPTQLK